MDNAMWKTIVAGSTAALVAGSAIAYAQQDASPKPAQPNAESRSEAPKPRVNAEDMRAFGEARLAALRAGLMLNPEQDKHWAPYEQAVRNFAKVRMDRREAMRSQQPPADRLEAMRSRADAMVARATALKQLVDAVDPLYRSLDDAQKRRFAMLADAPTRHLGFGPRQRVGGEGRHGHGWNRGHHGDHSSWGRGGDHGRWGGWGANREDSRRGEESRRSEESRRGEQERRGEQDRRSEDSRRGNEGRRFEEGRRSEDSRRSDDRRERRSESREDRSDDRLREFQRDGRSDRGSGFERGRDGRRDGGSERNEDRQPSRL